MMPSLITYVYDGELTDLTAPSASWFFEPGVEPTTEQIAALAAALGVEGEVRELSADMGDGWMVGPDNYEQPTVNVGADAMQSWWYNPGNAAMSTPPCELYPPGDPAGDFDDPTKASSPRPARPTSPLLRQRVCGEAIPPANVPDTATAEEMARQLYTSLGFDADSYEFETYADEWGANVTGYLVLDGMRTSMAVSVGYGAEGALTWASGFLATPQRGADYPRIGIEAAVQRLNDQSSSWMGLDTPMMTDTGVAADSRSTGAGSSGSEGVAVADTTPVEPVEPVDPATDVAPAGETEPAVAPDQVVDPPEGVCLDDTGTECVVPTPIEAEPITVTLTNARPSLEQLWASDDTVWLLPGYAFDAADSGIYSVLAVEDKYIEINEPTAVPVPEPLPAVDPDAASPPPTTMLLPGWESAKPLVGLTEAEAAKVAEGNAGPCESCAVDGVDQPATADFSETRVNVAVDDGTVTEIISFG